MGRAPGGVEVGLVKQSNKALIVACTHHRYPHAIRQIILPKVTPNTLLQVRQWFGIPEEDNDSTPNFCWKADRGLLVERHH